MAAAPEQPARRHSLLAAVLQAVVLLAAFGFIGWRLAGQWDSLRHHAWTLRPAPALLSLALAAGWFVCRAWLWQRLLAAMGYPLSYGRAYRTWTLSELGRYLPGKVWLLLGRTYLAGRQGVAVRIVLTGMVFELALVSLAAIAFFPLRAASAGGLTGASGVWAAAVALALAALVHPRIVVPLINAGLRRVKRAPVAVTLSYRALLEMFALCVLMWISLSGGFALLAASLAPVGARDAVAVATSFPVAWIVGLLAFVAPGGLGVREGVLAALLSGLLPGGMAVVVALASRVWITAVELVCAAVASRLRE